MSDIGTVEIHLLSTVTEIVKEITKKLYREILLKLLTDLTVISSESHQTFARVTVDAIYTRSTITACVINTVVDA